MSTEKKVKYDGVLDLNGFQIPCYVLEDGTRVLSTTGLQNALGVTQNEPGQRSSGRLNEILESKLISPYLSTDYDASKYSGITVYKGNQKISAHEAIMLPELCDAILKGRDYAKENSMKVGKRQEVVFKHADILIRSLAKIGIIALVDEATGYQYEREKHELQVILKAFISEEILEWQRTFQLSFYKEIFRLWGIPFTPQNIKKKPLFIGKLTNSLVYRNLPQGTFVLEKLKEKTPRTKGGNLKYKLHQSLTKEAGREALIKVLNSVEALASISDTKKKFLDFMQDKYGQRKLNFPDTNELNELDRAAETNEPDSAPTEPLSDFNEKLNQALNFNPKEDKDPKKDKPKKQRGRPKKEKGKDKE